MDLIGVTNAEGIIVVKTSQIVYIEAIGQSSKLFMTDGVEIVSNKNLGWFEKVLSIQDFLRVHRSYLVNLLFVSRINKKGGQYIEFSLKNLKKLPVSKRKNEDLKKALLL